MPAPKDLLDFDPRRFARRLGRCAALAVALLLAALAAYSVAVHYLMPFRDLGYDTDAWFILAAGDHIMHEGIPYVNPWALTEGLGIVVQQWLHDCIMWLLWSENGAAGVRWFQVAMFAAVGAAAFASCRALSGRTLASALLAAAGTAIAAVYISARPTSWTMLAFLAAVVLCASYRKEPKPFKLALLALVQVVAANMQISMAPVVFLTAAAFLAPPASVVARPLAFARRYAADPDRDARAIASRFVRVEAASHLRATAPLALAVPALAALMLANPYGLDGALYVARGVGQASYGSFISEMQPGWPSSTLIPGALYAAFFAVPVILVLRARRARTLPELADDGAVIPLAILWAAGQVGFALAMRNIWIAALTTSLLSARLASHTPPIVPAPPRVAALLAKVPASVPCALIAACFVAAPVGASHLAAAYGPDMGGIFANMEPSSRGQLTALGTERFEDVESSYGPLVDAVISWRKSERRDPRVYMENPVAYSYLEFRGVKVPFDMRPEIWGEPIAGERSTEPYKAWIDAKKSGDMKAYIADGGWDFLIVSPDAAPEMCDLVGGKVVVETAEAALVSCPAG